MSVRMWPALLTLGLFMLLKVEATSYGGCDAEEFACSNGQCINHLFRCDGTKNCDDGSDESRRACDFHVHRGTCPTYAALTRTIRTCSHSRGDGDCEVYEKCCDTFTSYGYICMPPWEDNRPPFPYPHRKPGVCPRHHPSAYLPCNSRPTYQCDDDYHCPGDHKCCSTNCGRFCLAPQ